MKYLCVDIGTTCSKIQVFDDSGNILFYDTKECKMLEIGGEVYVNIPFIKKAVFDLIKSATKTVDGITSISFSSIGESFVLLDEKDEILTYPMIYTDNRGLEQAERIKKIISAEELFGITGVMPHSMFSIYKLLYIKENMPEKYGKANKLLLVCDYFNYVFSGERVIDYSLASRTGVFDIAGKRFSSAILEKVGVDINLFSTPKPLGTIIGKVKEDLAKELNLPLDCRVILGAHDQVCATIGAGAVGVGQSADGMGTVECITTIFDKIPKNTKMGYQGYPIVPFLDNLYCTYILNCTSNSIMNWYRNDILHNYTTEGKNQFLYLEERGEKITDLLVLPYFASSSTPYQDLNAKGSFVNMRLDTTDGDIYRAIMESTSFEMKFNLEVVREYGIKITDIVATGGGSNSKLWLQIKSDIFGLPVKTLRSAEGGLCGLAVISSVALKKFSDIKEAISVFVRYKEEVNPDKKYEEKYQDKYEKYKKLYKNLKELF